MDRQFQGEVMETKALVDLFTDMLEHKKREARILLIALVCSLCFNLATVIAFLYYEAHMETTVTTTTTQQVDGKDNDIVNGDKMDIKSNGENGVVNVTDKSQNRSQ